MTASTDAAASLKGQFPQVSDRPSLDHPAINVPASDLLAVLRAARDELGFDLLSDVTAVDWAEGTTPRFTVVHHLFSTERHDYLRIATACPDDANPEVPSAVGLWAAANWHEREAYDMFGIRFGGHPDLRRILMWEGYPHHPLRKEFPLAGIDGPLPDTEVARETTARVLPAPMMGGPFVAPSGGEMNLTESEPRAKDESWNERRAKPET